MCGIIGINSNKPVSVSIINSLKKLGVNSVQFKYQNEGAKVFEINNL